MNYDATFPYKIDELRDRITQWAQAIARSNNKDPELRRAMGELDETLEELGVAVAELRQQNEELIRSQAQLHEERERYRNLFEDASDGYFVTDAKGVILQANQVAGDLLKIAPSYLVGKNLLNFLGKNDSRNVRLQLQQLHQTKRCTGWTVQVLPRASASFFASITLHMVKGARVGGGEPDAISIRWMMRDISASVTAEMQIRSLNEHLENNRNDAVARIGTTKIQNNDFAAQDKMG